MITILNNKKNNTNQNKLKQYIVYTIFSRDIVLLYMIPATIWIRMLKQTVNDL